MKFCFGTVCWNGYLERYIDVFVDNYAIIFKRLINFGIDYEDIANPKVCYYNDVALENVEKAKIKLKRLTGKKLELICDRHKYSVDEVMYSTRNRLRLEFRKSFPEEAKVFFYFPVDDKVRSDVVPELVGLSYKSTPTACMFKFLVTEGNKQYTAATRPITSYNDIQATDWGGYCAYNILDEDKCPLYPEIAIPNVAFYAELYKAGYEEYASRLTCVDHLRHLDSHHFKYKDTEMSQKVKKYLEKKKEELRIGGYE